MICFKIDSTKGKKECSKYEPLLRLAYLTLLVKSEDAVFYLSYSFCDIISVEPVPKYGKYRIFGETSGVFGETKEWLGKHVLDFWETFVLILASYSAFGTCRTYTKN